MPPRREARLTPAQEALLLDLPTSCVSDYKPAIKLVELGLAEIKEGAYGTSRLVSTELGQKRARSIR